MVKSWYDKNYKLLLLVPAIILIASLIYLVGFYAQHGDVMIKDVSLTGGTSVTLFDEDIDRTVLSDALRVDFPDLQTRAISDFRSGAQKGILIETQAEASVIRGALEEYLGYELDNKRATIEFTGSTLSSGFYQQLRNAILAAFLLMGWVVFAIFGTSKGMKALTLMLTSVGISLALHEISALNLLAWLALLIGFGWGIVKIKKGDSLKRWIWITFVAALVIMIALPLQILLIPVAILLLVCYALFSIPSVAVILSAFADIVMTLAVVDLMGMRLSTAGVIAFLMLIGYSVDTDILLTTRLLRAKEEDRKKRLVDALKTGLTMTLTSIAAIGISFYIIFSLSEVLRQILGILLIGLGFDLVNTWFANAGLLWWYVNKKEDREE